MDPERGMSLPGNSELLGEAAAGTDGRNLLKDRTGPTWRGFVLSILAAVILSVMATLLLGGSWSSYSLHPAVAGASGGCGPGSSCCPPPEAGR